MRQWIDRRRIDRPRRRERGDGAVVSNDVARAVVCVAELADIRFWRLRRCAAEKSDHRVCDKVNKSRKPCRGAFILINGNKTPPAWTQSWKK